MGSERGGEEERRGKGSWKEEEGRGRKREMKAGHSIPNVLQHHTHWL